MRKPDFFIVGAPKCGTTAMYHYLDQHPQIFMPDRKELLFFGSDLRDAMPSYNLTLDKYLTHFSQSTDELKVGTAYVWYLYSDDAAKEIKEFNPEASIIIMLRNPVDMIYSSHSQFVYNGNENIIDFKKALAAETNRKQGLQIPDTSHFTKGLFYREIASYTSQIRRYLNVFDREKVHIIIFDNFKRDPALEYYKALQFLGLDTTYKPNFRVINPNRRVRNPTVQRLLIRTQKNLFRIGSKVLAKQYKAFLKPLLLPFFNQLQNFNVEITPRPPMDDELRRQLTTDFTAEVNCLSELLGQDLTHWSSF